MTIQLQVSKLNLFLSEKEHDRVCGGFSLRTTLAPPFVPYPIPPSYCMTHRSTQPRVFYTSGHITNTAFIDGHLNSVFSVFLVRRGYLLKVPRSTQPQDSGTLRDPIRRHWHCWDPCFRRVGHIYKTRKKTQGTSVSIHTPCTHVPLHTRNCQQRVIRISSWTLFLFFTHPTPFPFKHFIKA